MKNPYRICEGKCYIELRNGIETIIDQEDFNLINSFRERWLAHYDPCTKGFYCKIRHTILGGKDKTQRLSRIIMKITNSDLVVDHINHNTLDNTRANLRAVTKKSNSQSQIKKHTDNTSGFIGAFKTKRNKYIAKVSNGNKPVYLGTYATAEEASSVYRKWKESNGLVKQGAYTAACF